MKNDSWNDMVRFMRELFPICRSITGDGLRRTLVRIGKEVPVELHEIATGTQVFDWQVPDEWNIHEAYIEGPDGNRLVDFENNNLHIVNYSRPVDARMTLSELKPHIHTLPDHPDWIPYRTTYYQRNWGFCMAERQFAEMPDGDYRVRIDSSLDKGSLTLGELVIGGESDREILIWSHCCHPSLANDNLSGLAVSVWWAKHLLKDGPTRFSYRFVWGPGTIGSIAWLAMNQERWKKIVGGFVTVLLGRPGAFHYKRSRSGTGLTDRVAQRVLRGFGSEAEFRDFDPYGYDERQFGAPGINLPIGRLSRAPNGEYPEYHSSADNLSLVTGPALSEALDVCRALSDELERAEIYQTTVPGAEPQLGKRGLYRQIGGEDIRATELAMLWLLNQSDGLHSLGDIAERSGLSLESLRRAASRLVEAGLLDPV